MLLALPLVGRSTIPEFDVTPPVDGDEDLAADDVELGESSLSESLVDNDPVLDELRPVPELLGLVELPEEDCDVPVAPAESSPSSSSAIAVHGVKAKAATIAAHNGARLIRVSEILLLLIIAVLHALTNGTHSCVPYSSRRKFNDDRYELARGFIISVNNQTPLLTNARDCRICTTDFSRRTCAANRLHF